MIGRRARGAAVAALAAVVHVGSLGHPFVFDDHQGLLANPSIRDIRNWRWVLMGGHRIVTNFSYALDYTLFGPSPIAFHATTLLLHVLNTVLVYQLSQQLAEELREPPAVALLAASLFAVHPLLVESVGYASSRPGVLCMTFLLASLLAWRGALAGSRACVVAVPVFWIAAALSKETGLLAPLLATAHDLWIARDRVSARRRLVRLHLPLAALVVAAATARAATYLRSEGGLAFPQGSSVLTQATALWRYPLLLVAPVRLSIEHGVAAARASDPGAWLEVAASASGLLLLTLGRRQPLVTFGTAWFYLLLAPTLALPLSQPFAEHRVYEASLGGLWVLAVILARRPRWAIAPIALLSLLSIARHRVWRSEVALWSDAVEKAPRAWRAQVELADAERAAGRCGDALPHYRAAIALLPEGAQAEINLGVCLAELGELDDAAATLDRAVARSPADPRVRFDLALVERKRGRPEAAKSHLLRALAVSPDDNGARRLLIDILAHDLHDRPLALVHCAQLVAKLGTSQCGLEDH